MDASSSSSVPAVAHNRHIVHDRNNLGSNLAPNDRLDGELPTSAPPRYNRRGRNQANRRRNGARGAHTPPSEITSVVDSPASSSPSIGRDTSITTSHPHFQKPNTDDTGSTSITLAPGNPQKERPSHQERHPESNRRRRAPRFNADLTNSSTGPLRDTKESEPSRKHDVSGHQDDLTSRLIHDFQTHPYPDCVICFNSIHPAHQTWSCSPSSPIADVDSDVRTSNLVSKDVHCCWTTFHMKCIRAWADKSLKPLSEILARNEERIEWPCPACRAKRLSSPGDYKCFCGSTVDPKPPRLATPHSCGNPCSRTRKCGHPCPIACHPGPCPPCKVTTRLRCHCANKMLSFKCSIISSADANGGVTADLSCGNICSRMLDCGNHTCQSVCHPGDCGPCEVKKAARCHCGKEEADIGCGEGSPIECEAENEEKWMGMFACNGICARPLECGLHLCSKSCHPSSKMHAPCPLSPSILTSCPCGKRLLDPSEAPHFPLGSKLPRTQCTDPIPTCTSTCMKQRLDCSHVCPAPCHTGPCPPCTTKVIRPCRCGAKNDLECHVAKLNISGGILCDRPCTALRACGKHRCNRICCPLAFVGASKGKSKKFATEDTLIDEQGWHLCDFVCGKWLTCGNHRCEEKEHKGACPPCLRSSFEEKFCYCGQTVLEPPIRCGTSISCVHPCRRPLPPCGHPNSLHSCHEDPTTCPPCPFLTSKLCGCGKKSVDNVRCSRQNISCGTPCGKLMKCGFHRCERLCHSDDCGTCQIPCGKPRKLCLPANHPCTAKCHAPSVCPETEECRASIDLTCLCERIHQRVSCGRSISRPSGKGLQQLNCSSECGVAKRNARLADALGISKEKRTEIWKVDYSDELLAFARVNPKVCVAVEKSFTDFVSSDKKSQVLPHMPEARRQIIQELAAVYRIDTQIVDQEPHRSVQLIRRMDTRIPKPLLSNAAASSSVSGSYDRGKHVDARAQSRSTLSMPIAKATIPPHSVTPDRGWSSVISRSDLLASGPAWSSSSIPPSEDRAPTSGSDNASINIPVHNEPVPDNWEEDT